MIREYEDLGYEQIFDLYFVNYRPDAIVQNDFVIVLLEAVDSSDHPTFILPTRIGPRIVEIDKRYVRGNVMSDRLLRVRKRQIRLMSQYPKRRSYDKRTRYVERVEALSYQVLCAKCQRRVYVTYNYGDKKLCENCMAPYIKGILKAIHNNKQKFW